MTVYNFSAGPAVLPKPVIQQIQAELPSLNDSGMSILEISHRSQMFDEIIDEAKDNLTKLLNIPAGYQVLFFQGGGTGQFAAAPMNMAGDQRKIAVLDSGHWADRAYQEALKIGFKADVLKSTKSKKYTELPRLNQENNLSGYDYLHVTMNNTIEGTAYHKNAGNPGIPVVADMSSNFLAEQYQVSDYGMIFAGAQKNVGPAGVTIVIVKESLISQAEFVPSILDYNLMIKKNSMFNTPPVFSIYSVNLVLKWLLNEIGGVANMEKINQEKAGILYEFLDNSKLFSNNIKVSDRSLTNIPFTTGNEDLDAKLVSEATAAGLMNLKGHRSVGGLRASLYNAMPLEGAKALVEFLHQFETNN
ncbi:3-phosphoserine/phosphohydroxythreonine transaminase [Lentilactobacillus sp. Marseille-Q4993]|uniref:3-phosphoserine/phosphohydroxythreonine transaminase n=1 Tax=Lentilactobacillus sp. Marseille-Q4993 TaxID=3039492 RepID=UPI0024BC7F8B|nr:3-phosphoserine/phosphohydroxythreonine transaminase [Lentilactobacillus sp. Marseille-Q4993]